MKHFTFKRMLKAISLGITACMMFASCGGHISDDTNNAETAAANTNAADTAVENVSSADMTEGSFTITLYPEYAPITCENFENLVSSGFYDGLTFHRVVDGFMAQGGDPSGDGTGGSDETIKGEFSSNGVENALSHTRGIVSMARSSDPDSASSQFFICYDDSCNFLDGNYAAFGEVTEGMDVVDKFLNVERTLGGDGAISSPTTPITITKAEIIGKDSDDHDQAKFTVTFTEKPPREQVEGKFIITLRADKAPITVENFVNLVKSGFYDGLTFHRVVEGFMAQGGDPNGNGTGGSDETIKGEFSSNGVDNDLSHTRGVVSMARSSDPDSASSQFFICYDDSCSFLDGDYAAFGEVTEGMEVVDGFLEVDRTLGSDGAVSSPMTPITIEKAEIIDNDSDGNQRAEFTVLY